MILCQTWQNKKYKKQTYKCGRFTMLTLSRFTGICKASSLSTFHALAHKYKNAKMRELFKDSALENLFYGLIF